MAHILAHMKSSAATVELTQATATRHSGQKTCANRFVISQRLEDSHVLEPHLALATLQKRPSGLWNDAFANGTAALASIP